jgi:hypothetical protein
MLLTDVSVGSLIELTNDDVKGGIPPDYDSFYVLCFMFYVLFFIFFPFLSSNLTVYSKFELWLGTRTDNLYLLML